MADPARIHSDGPLAFGSQKATCVCNGANVANCIFEQFSIKQMTTVLTSKDENGRPNKRVIIEQEKAGEATVQLPALTTAAADTGSHVSLFPLGANTANAAEAIVFTVNEPGQIFDQNDVKKFTVSLLETLNP